MTRQPCQCQRWPERCWATPAGTRGLCPVCMTGKCERPRPVTSEYADVTHRAPGTGANLDTEPAPGSARPVPPALSS